MYCTRCGKKLDYDAKICNECAAKEAPRTDNPYANAQATTGALANREPEGVYTNAQTTVEAEVVESYSAEPRPEGNRKFGLPKALVAIILGVVGSVISNINLTVSGAFAFIANILQFGGEAEMGSAVSAGSLALSIILGIATLAMGIVAICFGAISIKAFKSHKAETGVAPVPTLVLGIVGLVFGVGCVISSGELFLTLIGNAISDFAMNSMFDNSPSYF